jgi:hypothetical protein
MTTGVEDGIVVFLLDAIEARRPVELGVGVGILLEPTGDVGLEGRLVALGIERRAPALGRCKGDLGAGIFEDILRRCQFLQPEASLPSRIAELVVGGKNHQDFHDALLSLVVEEWPALLCCRPG